MERLHEKLAHEYSAKSNLLRTMLEKND
jgi:hypothetical protein